MASSNFKLQQYIEHISAWKNLKSLFKSLLILIFMNFVNVDPKINVFGQLHLLFQKFVSSHITLAVYRSYFILKTVQVQWQQIVMFQDFAVWFKSDRFNCIPFAIILTFHLEQVATWNFYKNKTFVCYQILTLKLTFSCNCIFGFENS